MKVLITDDEIQIRRGLRMKVDWEEEGFIVVEEASNGKEALELLQNINVDVVLTDIRMPIMDGIALAKHCQQEFPGIKVIVLSGYSDFEYVRSSMKEGVKDYLLKPVAPDELLEVLRKIRKEVEEDKRKQIESARIHVIAETHLQEVQDQFLLHLAKDEWLEFSYVLERLWQLQLEDLAQENIKVKFLSVEIRECEDNLTNLKKLCLPFQMICKEIAKELGGTYSFYDPSYANMVHFLKIIDLEQTNSTAILIKKVQQSVKTSLNLETVIGIGNTVTGLSEMKNGYISSLLSWSQSQLGSHSQVMNETVTRDVIYEFEPDFERQLTNAIEGMNIEAFKNTVNTVLKKTENQSVLSFCFVANRVFFLLGSLAKKYNMETKDIQKSMWNCQQSIGELNSQSKSIDHLIQLAQVIVEKISVARFSNGQLMDNIRQYLDEHYASEISLTSLSELFYINSSYLSDTFKNHIGKNYSEYLVELRVEKAKFFLEDERLKIIDVANLVGFSNSGYFSTVFKKHVGKTPVEFRNFLDINGKVIR
ncbi:two-component system response regulator [Salipaludibacillus neizhouensis]|uniref:Two-component system response regulator n=2 Tax=Salipaludibacillus neizhouensis TaxID=885475 RepID=A0A3A9K900_9BACI|nr:two-component system response regulator [Salipaludibacillus neizhouensis]